MYRLYRMYRLFYGRFVIKIANTGMMRMDVQTFEKNSIHFYTCRKPAWLLGLPAFWQKSCIDFENKVYTAKIRDDVGRNPFCIECIDFFQTTYIYF